MIEHFTLLYTRPVIDRFHGLDYLNDGWPIGDLVATMPGYITEVRYQMGDEIDTARGAQIAELPPDTMVISFTESPNVDEAPHEVYPVLKLFPEIEYNDALVATLYDTNFERTMSQKDAAVAVLQHVFGGKSIDETKKIYDDWVKLLEYPNSGRSSNVNEVLVSAISSLGKEILENLGYLNKYIVLSDNGAADINVNALNYRLGRTMLSLVLVLDVDERPSPVVVRQAMSSRKEAYSSIRSIEQYSENMIMFEVVKAVKANGIMKEFVEIRPRDISVIKQALLDDPSASDFLVDHLSINERTFLRRQFSFGRSPGNPKYLREMKWNNLGFESISEKISIFCESLLKRNIPRRDNANKSNELYRCKTFARAWGSLSNKQKLEAVPILLNGTINDMARFMEIGTVNCATFMRSVDKHLLDGYSVSEIYPQKKVLNGISNAGTYNQTYEYIYGMKLDTVLPKRSEEIIAFMVRYNQLIADKMSDNDITTALSSEFGYASSYVSILHQKARTFADIVTLARNISLANSTSIYKAWVLLDFVDKVKAVKISRKFS